MLEPTAQCRITVQPRQVTEQLTGGNEQHGVPLSQRLMAQVAGQHGLAHSVGAHQHDVAGVSHEGQGHEFLDGLAVTARWPAPFKISQWFELANVRRAQPALQTALVAFRLFPPQQFSDPSQTRRITGHLVPAGQQSAQSQGVGARLKLRHIAHVAECRLGARH